MAVDQDFVRQFVRETFRLGPKEGPEQEPDRTKHVKEASPEVRKKIERVRRSLRG